MLGGFLRNPPQLEHTGTGQFTITNYKDTQSYSVFTLAGEVQANTSVVDGVVTLNGNYGEFYVGFASDTALRRATRFVRTQITYRTETTTSCSPACAPNGGPNGANDCWCGTMNPQGDLCCGGCYGENCSTSSYQVKNPVPAGYTERYGEWVKIENPDGATTQEAPIGFSLPKVEWDDDYHQVIQMPEPEEAREFDPETGGPGAPIPNKPSWDYNIIYFMHFDTEGQLVWTRDNQTNPECFTIVQKELMKDYEMWVSHLPPAVEGTYEFVIAKDDKEIVREEGNV